MELVTFQTMKAFKKLIQNGYLTCDEQYINLLKADPTYQWVLEKMTNKPKNVEYPLWAWVKYKNGICPPIHKRKEPKTQNVVKITFIKASKELFITDFRAYSFVLNNLYLPTSKKNNQWFEQELQKRNITKDELKAYVRKDKFDTHRTDKQFMELISMIRKSWDRCITNESDVLQACFWKLELKDIVKIEFCNDDNYDYGSANYVRANGKRPDWKKQYIESLK